MTTKNLRFTGILLAIVITLIGCGGYGPSQGTCQKALKSAVERQIPASWTGSLFGGKNTYVDFVNILAIGSPRDIRGTKYKYWTVRARVGGSCEAGWPISKRKRFDEVGEFYVYKDRYGEWKAADNMASVWKDTLY